MPLQGVGGIVGWKQREVGGEEASAGSGGSNVGGAFDALPCLPVSLSLPPPPFKRSRSCQQARLSACLSVQLYSKLLPAAAAAFALLLLTKLHHTSSTSQNTLLASWPARAAVVNWEVTLGVFSVGHLCSTHRDRYARETSLSLYVRPSSLPLLHVRTCVRRIHIVP